MWPCIIASIAVHQGFTWALPLPAPYQGPAGLRRLGPDSRSHACGPRGQLKRTPPRLASVSGPLPWKVQTQVPGYPKRKDPWKKAALALQEPTQSRSRSVSRTLSIYDVSPQPLTSVDTPWLGQALQIASHGPPINVGRAVLRSTSGTLGARLPHTCSSQLSYATCRQVVDFDIPTSRGIRQDLFMECNPPSFSLALPDRTNRQEGLGTPKPS